MIKSNRAVKTNIKLNKVIYEVTMLVLMKTHLKILLGNAFLIQNDAIIDYGGRISKLQDEAISFLGCEKEIHEVLDERLTKNLCSFIGNEKLINFLKSYEKNNKHFCALKSKQASFNLIKNFEQKKE